jgi:hypothetical protein
LHAQAGQFLCGTETSSWWNVGLAVTPCFNSQAPPLDHSHTFTRRMLVIVVGVTVLLSTNYYAAFILNGFIVQDKSAAYPVDELADKLYFGEMKAMFYDKSNRHKCTTILRVILINIFKRYFCAPCRSVFCCSAFCVATENAPAFIVA